MLRKPYAVVLWITLIMIIAYQVYLLWAVCQGSCFDDVSYMCQDCVTPRCSDYGCLSGPEYWEGDCCCMKPGSSDRCCYYRCHAYMCLSFDPDYFYYICVMLNEVYHDYYVDFVPSVCDNLTGICVRPTPIVPPGGAQ